jgi:hypothetical protein
VYKRRHAGRRVGAFIEDVYKADRLHAAFGRQSPVAFEAALRKTANRIVNLEPPWRRICVSPTRGATSPLHQHRVPVIP